MMVWQVSQWEQQIAEIIQWVSDEKDARGYLQVGPLAHGLMRVCCELDSKRIRTLVAGYKLLLYLFGFGADSTKCVCTGSKKNDFYKQNVNNSKMGSTCSRVQ